MVTGLVLWCGLCLLVPPAGGQSTAAYPSPHAESALTMTSTFPIYAMPTIGSIFMVGMTTVLLSRDGIGRLQRLSTINPEENILDAIYLDIIDQFPGEKVVLSYSFYLNLGMVKGNK